MVTSLYSTSICSAWKKSIKYKIYVLVQSFLYKTPQHTSYNTLIPLYRQHSHTDEFLVGFMSLNGILRFQITPGIHIWYCLHTSQNYDYNGAKTYGTAFICPLYSTHGFCLHACSLLQKLCSKLTQPYILLQQSTPIIQHRQWTVHPRPEYAFHSQQPTKTTNQRQPLFKHLYLHTKSYEIYSSKYTISLQTSLLRI